MSSVSAPASNPDAEGAHVYCHSRKDSKSGVVYLIINNSLTQNTTVHLPKAANRYTLSAKSMRSSVMQLNGCNLTENNIDEVAPVVEPAGKIDLMPGSCTFLVL